MSGRKEKIMIVATPRSGTQFIAKVLNTDFKYKVGHEHTGINGIVSWWHHKKSDLNKFDVILHQVRHPLNSITSSQFLHAWSSSRRDAKKVFDIPEPFDNLNLILKGMKMWYHGHKYLETISEWQYNIEDLSTKPDIFKEWCKRLNIEKHEDILTTKIPKNTGTRNRKNHVVTWEDLENMDKELTNNIKELAIKYGYKL